MDGQSDSQTQRNNEARHMDLPGTCLDAAGSSVTVAASITALQGGLRLLPTQSEEPGTLFSADHPSHTLALCTDGKEWLGNGARRGRRGEKKERHTRFGAFKRSRRELQ